MNQKILLASFLLAVGILLFLALALIPLIKGVGNNARELESLYVQVLASSAAEQEAAEYLKFSKERQEDFLALENALIDPATPIAFIEFVEQSAFEAGIQVRITPGQAKKRKGSPWPVMDFQLASAGSYPEFLRFLTKIEQAPFLLEAKNTSVLRERALEGEEGLAQDVNFTLLVELFTRPLAESAP